MAAASYSTYLARRVILTVVSIFIIISFNFLLFRVLPGNPITLLYRSPRLTLNQEKALSIEFGLNRPEWVQYILYVKNALEGNFGISYYYKVSVTSKIIPALENSLILLIPATIISILLGIYTGVFSAWRENTKADVAVLQTAMAFYAMPTFWLGGIFILIAIYIGGIPVAGEYSVGSTSIINLMEHMALPLLTLVLVYYGQFTIMMRNSLRDVLSEDYILTAYAKGADSKRILYSHAVPNAMLPMISLIAINLGLMVTGAILVETVFSWPGIGYLIYQSIGHLDYPMLQGAFIIVTFSVVLANLLADIVYGLVDPRIRYK